MLKIINAIIVLYSKTLIWFILIFLINVKENIVCAQTDRIYFIGDAGEDAQPGQALLNLQKEIEKDSNSVVVFLGDNCYPHGLPNLKIQENDSMPYRFKEAANFLSQLQILKKYRGEVFYVPGNHDWNAQKRGRAQQSVNNERIIAEKYIDDSTQVKNKSEMNYFTYNAYGSISPFSKKINDKTELILFDSQYFFQKIKGRNSKERKSELVKFIGCTDSLMQIAAKEGRRIIMASHHPLITNGSHSRKRQPLRFLVNYSPLWIFGKLGLHRWLSQDIDAPFYKYYRKQFSILLKKYENVIWVAGHDHNLQMLNEDDDIHLISGSGSKTNKLKRENRFYTTFSNDEEEGFLMIDIEKAHPEVGFYLENTVKEFKNE